MIEHKEKYKKDQEIRKKEEKKIERKGEIRGSVCQIISRHAAQRNLFAFSLKSFWSPIQCFKI